MYKPCLSPEMIKTSFSVVVTSVLVTDVDITIFGENLEVLVTVTDSFGVTRLKIVTVITQAINKAMLVTTCYQHHCHPLLVNWFA